MSLADALRKLRGEDSSPRSTPTPRATPRPAASPRPVFASAPPRATPQAARETPQPRLQPRSSPRPARSQQPVQRTQQVRRPASVLQRATPPPDTTARDRTVLQRNAPGPRGQTRIDPSSQPSRIVGIDERGVGEAPDQSRAARSMHFRERENQGLRNEPEVRPGLPVSASAPRTRQEGERGTVGRQEFYELTWEDYNRLDPAAKAAVDANSLLQEALERDRALISQLDANRDGRVSFTEGRQDFGSDFDQYRANVQRVFSRGSEWGVTRDEDELDYAPNTVATLNLLGLTDREGDLDDYLSGRAFITDDDLREGRHARTLDNVQSVELTPRRSEWLSGITQATQQLSDSLDSGRAIIDGYRTSVSITGAGSDRMGQLVESLRNDLAAGASFDTLFDDNPSAGQNRVDLSPLIDEDYSYHRDTMEMLFEMMATDGRFTAEFLTSEQSMLPYLQENQVSWDEWNSLMQQKERTLLPTETVAPTVSGQNDPNAYVSTAGG